MNLDIPPLLHAALYALAMLAAIAVFNVALQVHDRRREARRAGREEASHTAAE